MTQHPIGGVIALPPDHETLIAAWVEHLATMAEQYQLMPETVRTYRATMQRWGTWMRENQVDQPGPAEVNRFLADLRRTTSATTCNRHLHALRSLYRWTEANGLYPAIARSIRTTRVQRDGPLPALSRDEVMALLAQTWQAPSTQREWGANRASRERLSRLRDEALVRVLFNTGLRLISLHRMDLNDIDLKADPPVIRYAGKGHREKDTPVFLANESCAALQDYLDARSTLATREQPAVWIGCDTTPGDRLSVRSMRSIIARCAEGAGLLRRNAQHHVIERGRWGPHALRRAAATHAVDGYGLEAGQTLMGHRSPETTRSSYVRSVRWRQLQQVRSVLDLPARTENGSSKDHPARLAR